MIHIAEFAAITHRSIQSTRHLIYDHIGVRTMKFFRDRSRVMIPVAELYGFPLTDKGTVAAGVRNIYHYKLVDGEFQNDGAGGGDMIGIWWMGSGKFNAFHCGVRSHKESCPSPPNTMNALLEKL